MKDISETIWSLWAYTQKVASNSNIQNMLPIITRIAIFLCPPSSKPIDPSLTQLSCNKANVIDHCCPLLQASRRTSWPSGWTKYDYSPTWKSVEIQGISHFSLLKLDNYFSFSVRLCDVVIIRVDLGQDQWHDWNWLDDQAWRWRKSTSLNSEITQ